MHCLNLAKTTFCSLKEQKCWIKWCWSVLHTVLKYVFWHELSCIVAHMVAKVFLLGSITSLELWSCGCSTRRRWFCDPPVGVWFLKSVWSPFCVWNRLFPVNEKARQQLLFSPWIGAAAACAPSTKRRLRLRCRLFCSLKDRCRRNQLLPPRHEPREGWLVPC
jgi:hypothetical protein